MKKGVLKKIAKFTGKYLCQSLFFDKAAGLRPATFLKRDWRIYVKSVICWCVCVCVCVCVVCVCMCLFSSTIKASPH